MAHKQQIEFCQKIKNSHSSFFSNKKVLDVGSLDINGNNRYLFENCEYTVIDIGEGRNVDIVCKAHEHSAQDQSYDFIISTECFEHDMHYEKTLKNIIRMLKPGGMFLFTCATTGREEHGTRRAHSWTAPLLSQHGQEWSDYYKNLTEEDIESVLELNNTFSEYKFEENIISCDLYFYGIKK